MADTFLKSSFLLNMVFDIQQFANGVSKTADIAEKSISELQKTKEIIYEMDDFSS